MKQAQDHLTSMSGMKHPSPTTKNKSVHCRMGWPCCPTLRSLVISVRTCAIPSPYLHSSDFTPGSSAGSSILQTIFSLLSLKGPLDDPSRKELTKFIATRQHADSRALGLEGDLASGYITEGLIDAYFLLYNTSYPILHAQLFRESYNNRSQIASTLTWQLIFYTVLAIGHWVLSSGEDHADSPYYLAARSRMSAGMLESGTLAGVQAFLLMVTSFRP